MKRPNIIFVFAILLSIMLYTENTMAQDGQYLPFAQVMPKPVGGLKSVYSKITYPKIAKRAGIQGKVYLLVYVNQKGNVDDVKVIKGIGAGCDVAAINGLKQTKFTVGKNKGVPVKVKVSISINFKLE